MILIVDLHKLPASVIIIIADFSRDNAIVNHIMMYIYY